MLRQTTLVVLSLLLILETSSARQWSLPSSRVLVSAKLSQHDFSGKAIAAPRQPFGVLSSVVGLTGGEVSSTTEELPAALDSSNETQGRSPAGEIARGGSTTTMKPKPQQSHYSEVSFGAPNTTLTTFSSTASHSNETSFTSLVVAGKTENAQKPNDRRFHKRIAKKLKNRNATNKRRKFMHASFGIFFASLNHFIPKQHFVPGMAVLSSATLVMELLRYRKGFGWMNEALHFVLGKALRKHEMDGKFTGSFYFFTGVTLTAALFPTSSATLGIIQLAIADPTASYFGRATRHVYWSRIENGLGGIGRNKGFLGFLGGALCCVPFNYRILSLAKFGAQGVPGGKTSVAIASLALGMAGAFADLAVPTPALTMPKRICGVRVPPFHLDDNFVVPIVSGYACTKVFQALGWQQNLELGRFLFLK